jgi:hypothetical protein
MQLLYYYCNPFWSHGHAACRQTVSRAYTRHGDAGELPVPQAQVVRLHLTSYHQLSEHVTSVDETLSPCHGRINGNTNQWQHS